MGRLGNPRTVPLPARRLACMEDMLAKLVMPLLTTSSLSWNESPRLPPLTVPLPAPCKALLISRIEPNVRARLAGDGLSRRACEVVPAHDVFGHTDNRNHYQIAG